jgi:hypothetical protein
MLKTVCTAAMWILALSQNAFGGFAKAESVKQACNTGMSQKTCCADHNGATA